MTRQKKSTKTGRRQEGEKKITYKKNPEGKKIPPGHFCFLRKRLDVLCEVFDSSYHLRSVRVLIVIP